MATSAIAILTQLSVLLLFGVIGSALARKLNISNVLILLLFGFGVGAAMPWVFNFEETLLVALAIITLAMVIFEGTSKLSYRTLDQYSTPALQLTVWQVLFVTFFVGTIAWALFFEGTPSGFIMALVLVISLAGTDPSSVLLMVKDAGARVVQLLTLEAVINTPIMVVLPFMLLEILNDTFSPDQLLALLQQAIVGVGTGVLLGLIVFKALRKYYSKNITTVAVLSAALLAYLLAEILDGSGVLSVATLGILFGNLSIRNKEQVQTFSFEFSNVLELLIFVLIGVLIGEAFPLNAVFLFETLLLFLAFLVVRAAAAWLVLRKDYAWNELIFIALTAPKGIAVAVLIFTYAVVPQIPDVLLHVLFAITVYSIAVATAVGWWWKLPDPKEKKGKKGKK